MVWIALPRVSDLSGGWSFPSGKVGQIFFSLKIGYHCASLMFMSFGVIG
jgi:hypothetical protein